MILMLDSKYSPEALGFLPSFLDESDPRPAREQLDANYQHGGGWRPIDGFELDVGFGTLRYPGDPPLQPIAAIILHADEVVLFYPFAIVMILQKDDTFTVARMD